MEIRFEQRGICKFSRVRGLGVLFRRTFPLAPPLEGRLPAFYTAVLDSGDEDIQTFIVDGVVGTKRPG